MKPREIKLHNRVPKFVYRLRDFLFSKRVPAKTIFIIIGLFSTLWFLVRVIPKPSRATYPCMRASYPFMAGFMSYLIGLLTATLAFYKSKNHFKNARYAAWAFCLAAGITAAVFTSGGDSIPVYANSKLLLGANQPIGIAKGMYPGRVVWVWDSSATNENCTNEFGDGWFMDKNTNFDVVCDMVNNGIMKLTETESINEAWEALFKDFNKNHGKGESGYTEGEKIFIRTNQVSAGDGTYNTYNFAINNQNRYGMAETSPQVVLAVLRQLVNECGVAQENISVGDPMKHMYKHVYDMWHDEFPDVIYIDKDARLGRTMPISDGTSDIFYSDRGTILDVTSDEFPTVITEADYLINIPAMKAHARGGVTLTAKLHFGSNMRSGASHLHKGLVAPDKMSNTSTWRTGYGLYRVQVDLMADENLGGKTILYLVDALWGGSEANDPPRKFSMAPFNNDWTSSVFLAQDPVAIESVCFDFLKAEFTEDNPYGSYPQMDGVDDYIMQAADSNYWSTGFTYDPENDGTSISSLGVCEHWNNSVDKEYSRNLDSGDGIELVWLKNEATSVDDEVLPSEFVLYQNYPNPFNPSTNISFTVNKSGHAVLTVYDILGREVATLFNGNAIPGEIYKLEFNSNEGTVNGLASGIYISRLEFDGRQMTKKMVLMK